MPDPLPSAPPLVVFPGLWRSAAALHPSGPGYDWRDRWRALTRLAREFRHSPMRHLLALAGPGERALLPCERIGVGEGSGKLQRHNLDVALGQALARPRGPSPRCGAACA
jgi:hypothetical protein